MEFIFSIVDLNCKNLAVWLCANKKSKKYEVSHSGTGTAQFIFNNGKSGTNTRKRGTRAAIQGETLHCTTHTVQPENYPCESIPTND